MQIFSLGRLAFRLLYDRIAPSVNVPLLVEKQQASSSWSGIFAQIRQLHDWKPPLRRKRLCMVSQLARLKANFGLCPNPIQELSLFSLAAEVLAVGPNPIMGPLGDGQVNRDWLFRCALLCAAQAAQGSFASSQTPPRELATFAAAPTWTPLLHERMCRYPPHSFVAAPALPRGLIGALRLFLSFF